MLIKIESIYDILSLITLVANIYIICSMNFYLIIGMLFCVYIHNICKDLTKGSDIKFLKRPDGAHNCDLFNTGGNVENNSGFPSGHVTSISYLMNYLYIKEKNKSWKKWFMYHLPIMMVGVGRVGKGCHNMIQVFAGYLLGWLGAKIITKIEKLNVKENNKICL